jgi:hypothetical protein
MVDHFLDHTDYHLGQGILLYMGAVDCHARHQIHHIMPILSVLGGMKVDGIKSSGGLRIRSLIVGLDIRSKATWQILL